MSDPIPVPAPSRRRMSGWERTGLIVVVVVLALAYAATAVLYGRSAGNRGLTIEATPPEGGVAVKVAIISIDPATQTVRGRLSIDPADSLADDAGRLLEGITLITTATKESFVYPAGQRPQPEDVTFFIDGAFEDYPLDRWSTLVVAVAFPTGTPADDIGEGVMPVSLGIESSVPSWVTRQISIEDFGDAVLEGPVTYAGLRFSRAGSTLAIVVLVLTLMTVLALLGVLVSLAVATGRRRVEPTLAGFMAALLFALVPLRNALPGAPPLGAWIDFLVFFWVEILLMAGLALYVITWLQRGARPAAEVAAGGVVVPVGDDVHAADDGDGDGGDGGSGDGGSA